MGRTEGGWLLDDEGLLAVTAREAVDHGDYRLSWSGTLSRLEAVDCRLSRLEAVDCRLSRLEAVYCRLSRLEVVYCRLGRLEAADCRLSSS